MHLQKNMDYENLAFVLLQRKGDALLLSILTHPDILKLNKKKAVIGFFKECLR